MKTTNFQSQRGVTLAELVFAVALGALIVAISVPAFSEILERVRHSTAVRTMISDIREARSRAIAQGWQYRIVGYDSDSTGARANQYRVLARRSNAVAWPAEESTPFVSDTQRADAWVDVEDAYHGVLLDSDDSKFVLTFNSKGAAANADADFNPLRLIGKKGMESSVSVSVAGGIQLQ